jgi:glycosyltransferase involved in cell wall biosynthesis
VMMANRGHQVIHYGAEGAQPDELEAQCVDVISAAQRERWWPDHDIRDFFPDIWKGYAEWWALLCHGAAVGIAERYQDGDFVCCIAGKGCHSMIPDMLPKSVKPTVVEFGVGYEGVFSEHRVWESNAHRHYVLGKRGEGDGSFLDAVIPNYFDPNDFRPSQPEDYYLYLGRIINRKGVKTAVAACRKLGVKLKIAGQGGTIEGNKLVFHDPNRGEIPLDSNVEYLGVITSPDERAKLIAGAIAMFVPTQYFEPFGGVFAEGLMSGVPVLTSDWGAFPEYVRQGQDGFRCNMLGDYVDGAQEVAAWGERTRVDIRTAAHQRFSVDRAAEMYEAYFGRLQRYQKGGWNA